MLDKLIIVKEADLAMLKAKVKLWGIGWFLALIMVCFSGVLVFQTKELAEDIRVTSKKQTELLELSESQANAIINAWAEYRQNTGAMIEFGNYIQSRENIVDFNQKNKPVITRKEYFRR